MGAPARFDDTTWTDKRYLKTGQRSREGGSALMLGGQESDLARTHEHPPGTVLAFYTAGDGYVRADDANADTMTPARVTALVTNPGGGGWDGDLTIKGSGFPDLVVALAGANTNTAVRDAIIAAAAAINPEGMAPVSAELVGAGADERVRIFTAAKGKGTWIHAVSEVAGMFGAAGTGGNGTSPKIRVTKTTAWLKDSDDADQDYFVDTLLAGDFDTSELSGLTAEARAVLEQEGSAFD